MEATTAKLLLATHALRDLHMGWPHQEIAATNGKGLGSLTRELVLHLAQQGALGQEDLKVFLEAFDDLHKDLAEALVVPEFEPTVLVIEAVANDDNGEGPGSTSIEITPDFLRSIISKATALHAMGLEYGHDGGWDHAWDDPDEEFRMSGTDLVICPGRTPSFWFHGHPKHALYSCESREIDLKQLLGALWALEVEGELPDNFVEQRGVLFRAEMSAQEIEETFAPDWMDEHASAMLSWVLYHRGEPEGARYWNEEDGWTNLDGATLYGRRPKPTYPLGGGQDGGNLTQAEPVDIELLREYTVIGSDGSKDWFFAEDEERARIAFEEAHPGISVSEVHEAAAFPEDA